MTDRQQVEMLTFFLSEAMGILSQETALSEELEMAEMWLAAVGYGDTEAHTHVASWWARESCLLLDSPDRDPAAHPKEGS